MQGSNSNRKLRHSDYFNMIASKGALQKITCFIDTCPWLLVFYSQCMHLLVSCSTNYWTYRSYWICTVSWLVDDCQEEVSNYTAHVRDDSSFSFSTTVTKWLSDVLLLTVTDTSSITWHRAVFQRGWERRIPAKLTMSLASRWLLGTQISTTQQMKNSSHCKWCSIGPISQKLGKSPSTSVICISFLDNSIDVNKCWWI